MHHRCCFPGCEIVCRGPTVRSFFQPFAKSRLAVLDQWKKACGVEEFPKNAFVCSDHFRDEDFLNPNHKTQGLKRNAVPTRNPNSSKTPYKDDKDDDDGDDESEDEDSSMDVDGQANDDDDDNNKEDSSSDDSFKAESTEPPEPEEAVKPPAPKMPRRGEIRYVGEIDEDALDCLPEVRRAFKVLKKAIRQDKARLAMYQKRNSRLRDELDLLKKVLDESEEDGGRSAREILEQLLENKLSKEPKESTKRKFEPKTIEPVGKALTIGRLGKISCRMCLRTNREVKAGRSVFGPFAGENFLSDIIEACFGVRIEPHDFCTKICEDCLVKVDVAWRMYVEFQSKRLAVDEFYYNLKFKKKPADQIDHENSEPDEVDLSNDEALEDPANNPGDPDPDDLESSDSECYSLPEHPFFTEHSKSVYLCHLCEAQFERANSLEYHLYTNHHEGDEPEQMCEFCSKFLVKRQMRTHLEAHTGPRPVCSVCDRSFSNSCNLTRHMAVHAKEKPYACTMCDKSYTQSQTLREHVQRVHLAPKEARSNLSAKGRLKASMPCPVCDEKFKISRKLIEHVEENHPEHVLDVFPCQLCDKQFITSAQLKTHRAMYHSEKEYCCDQCGKVFPTPGLLNNHLKFHRTEDS